MKTIRMDFAPPSVMRTVVQTRPAAWLFGLIGIALCIVVATNAIKLVEQKNAQQADADRLNATLAQHISKKPAAVVITISDPQGAAVNTAIGQLNLPWRDVFDAIEAATPSVIALLALEPDAKKQLLKGMAEAKTSDDMIAYIESLKQQEFFADVVLTRHEINGQDPNRPIRFQFQAHWNEVGQ